MRERRWFDRFAMQRINFRSLLGNLTLLTWVVLCVGIFMYFPGRISFVQWSNLGELPLLAGKLERINPIAYLFNLLLSCAGIASFSIACISLGIFLAGIFRIDRPANPSLITQLAFLATQFLLGHGVFSLIFLTFGALYKLTPLTVILILVLGFVLGLGQIKNNIPTFPSGTIADTSQDKLGNLIFRLSLICLFTAILHSSARISYDSSAIYFSDAKLTALMHHIQFFTNDTFVASVFQTVIQYSAIILLFGDQAARLFSWVCGLVIVIFSLAIAEQAGFSKQARSILLGILLTSTAFLDLLGDGKVDIISSMPAIAAIYWMVNHCQNKLPSEKTLHLIGFLVGLACVARPFNAFLLGVLLVLFYAQQTFFQNGFNPAGIKFFIHHLFHIAIGAIGLAIFHLFANWAIAGELLAFRSSVTRLDQASWQWAVDPREIFLIRLFYPFVVTFQNTVQSLGNVSPLFVAFLPALLIQDVRRNIKIPGPIPALLFASLITLALWIFLFFTVLEIRYVIFLWAILFLPLSQAASMMLQRSNRLLHSVLGGVILVLLVFSIVRTIYISLDTYSPLDEQGTPQCYDTDFCKLTAAVNKTAPPGERVLALHAFRYYLRSDLFVCSSTHEEYNLLRAFSYQGDSAFWEEVYRQGYKYIIYQNAYTTSHLQMGMIPDPTNTPNWLRLEPIYGLLPDLEIAYRIDATNPPIQVEKTCKKDAGGIWTIQTIKQ
jgi:hypothetical protein